MIILSLMMSFYSKYLPDFTFELKSLILSILMSVSSILFSCFLIIIITFYFVFCNTTLQSDYYVATVLSFKLGSLRATKRLWKVGVENHSFFRLSQADLPPKDVGFIKLGSKFRYRSVEKLINDWCNLDKPIKSTWHASHL